MKLIRRDHPTVLFSSKNKDNIKHSVDELISLVKTMSQGLKNKNLSIGVVGYPNTGKRTFITSLMEISTGIKISHELNKNSNNDFYLENNIKVISSPAHILSKNELGSVIPKNTKNVDELKTPYEVAKGIYDRISHDDLLEIYEIPDFDTYEEFITNISKKYKILIKVKIILFNLIERTS